MGWAVITTVFLFAGTNVELVEKPGKKNGQKICTKCASVCLCQQGVRGQMGVNFVDKLGGCRYFSPDGTRLLRLPQEQAAEKVPLRVTDPLNWRTRLRFAEQSRQWEK